MDSLHLDGSYQDDNLEWFDGYPPPSSDTDSKTYDTTLANIDMETFNLNRMKLIEYDEDNCERIASITCSILDQMGGSVLEPTQTQNQTHLEDSYTSSILKSKTLFSPCIETTAPPLQFSTDSLDLKFSNYYKQDNYQIAFDEPKVEQKSIQTSFTFDTSSGGNSAGNSAVPSGASSTMSRKSIPISRRMQPRKKRPLSCNDIEAIKNMDRKHIKHWPSLNFLLPKEVRDVFGESFDVEAVNQKMFTSRKDLDIIREIDKNLEDFEGFVTRGSQGGENVEAEAASAAASVQAVLAGQKKDIAESIAKACSNLKKHKSSTILSNSPAGKRVLNELCPSLYNLFSDGLNPEFNTLFGKIPNTVWSIVEASIQSGNWNPTLLGNFAKQRGPSTQILHELIMRINSEECLIEGPLKFNAFICGLLNLCNLSQYLNYLRSKERLLRTHYNQQSFLYLSNTTMRHLFDTILNSTNLKLNFQLDIFHECKLLHSSLKKVKKMKRSFSDERPNKEQMKSKVPKSKTAQNLVNMKRREGIEKGMEETNRVEKNKVENNFRKLQLQWEMMSSDKKFVSKIPRLVSPVKGGKRF